MEGIGDGAFFATCLIIVVGIVIYFAYKKIRGTHVDLRRSIDKTIDSTMLNIFESQMSVVSSHLHLLYDRAARDGSPQTMVKIGWSLHELYVKLSAMEAPEGSLAPAIANLAECVRVLGQDAFSEESWTAAIKQTEQIHWALTNQSRNTATQS